MEIYKYSNTIYMKVKRILIIISAIILSVLLALGVTFFTITNPNVKISGWEDLDTAKLERIHKTATIIDNDGNVIADGVYSKNKIYTPLEEIPKCTQDAFISIEDKRFYEHSGVDYLRMLGAAKNNIISRSFQEGASTITQQLIKNTHLSGEKTFSRKFQEIRIAKQLEKEYSKDEILEAYLNILYFGNNIYGIGQAAKSYFNKKVSQLSVAESALLAGIINNPSRYNPLTHPNSALKRRNIVLNSMAKNNKLSAAESNKAKQEQLNVSHLYFDAYSTYISSVINEAATNMDCLPDELLEKNPTITVCANCKIIDAVFSSMSDILLNTNYKIRILILDNVTSDVICDLSNCYDCNTALRQPGSAIKPFIAYAPALEKKLVYPSSIICDEKTDFNGYSPKNFDDKYYGNVTVADSLAKSLNIPAVKLTDMCGIGYAKSTASRFGITFSNKDNGLAIALGGLNDGITLNSLADAYKALANYGVYSKSKYVSAIHADGKSIYKNNTEKTQAIGKDTSFLITKMLKDCAQHGTAKKLNSFSNVAAKTGTVERGNKNSDAYCIAYTPRYTVAVWYGNDNDNVHIYGGKEPTKAAAKILSVLNDNSDFPVPDNVKEMEIDSRKLYKEGTVQLAAPTLPKRYCIKTYFSENNLPKTFSYDNRDFMFEFDFPLDIDNFEIFDSILE